MAFRNAAFSVDADLGTEGEYRHIKAPENGTIGISHNGNTDTELPGVLDTSGRLGGSGKGDGADKDTMTFTEIMTELGDMGIYQTRLLLLTAAPVIFCAMHGLSLGFVAATPQHRSDINSYCFRLPSCTIKWVPSINKAVVRDCALYAPSCSGISLGGLKWFPCVQAC